jgi:predicted metalloprotease with PDZ domain
VTDHKDVFLRIDLLDPASQTLKIELSWIPEVHMQRWTLPIWTPGSYTVRDPSQHLHSLAFYQQDQQVETRRLSPSRWSAKLPCLDRVRLVYQLEAKQLTVRTSFLDPEFASLCLSAVCMLVDGKRWERHVLELLLPQGWRGFVPLPQDDAFYISQDFDQLVDSPVHAGAFEDRPFIVDGCHHSLLLIGSPPTGWPDTLVEDIEAVCGAAASLMGESPPSGDRYQLVIQMLDSGYGGLEHNDGAVLQFAWPALAEPNGYHQLLQLVGHEYLHQWNVRRLRPREYIPYDHGVAVVSDSLWFAEGITSYFDLALPLLAGRSTRKTFLRDLGKDLSHVLLSPGVQVQSLADSSREAWVRLYKCTAAGADSQISYYKLGAALAFCLDVRLRALGVSLAQVVRDLWQSFGQVGRGYGRCDIQNALAVYSQELADQLPCWLDQKGTLPIKECLDQLGLILHPVLASTAWTGLTLADHPKGVRVTRVRFESPAHHANLVAGDEIVAVRGHRLYSVDQWTLLQSGAEPMAIIYARRGRLEETQVIPAPNRTQEYTVEWNPHAPHEARVLRDRWFEIH